MFRQRLTHCTLPAFWTLLAAALAVPSGPAAAQEAKAIASKVERVTLYRGQALVTRRVDAEMPKGPVEVVVPDLPENVVGDSLFAEGNEAVEVRAVRFRTRAVGQEPREEVRKLDDAIETQSDKITQNQKTQELLSKRAEYLDKLEGFVAPTAKIDASKGVLNSESLQKISEFSFTQRSKIATEQVAGTKESRELQKELQLLQRKRAELTAGAIHSVREAVLFLETRGAGKQAVHLSYLVNKCGWSPSYTYRAEKDGKQVRVEYNGLIQQLSGEDWKDVELVLSTASPALSSAAPGLAPFEVALMAQPPNTSPMQQVAQGQADVVRSLNELKGKQEMALKGYLNTINKKDNLDANWGINALANDFQSLELVGGKEQIKAYHLASEGGDGPSLSYRLPGKVNLASRTDQQMVRILQTGLESRFYNVATPVLTSYVYREAELTNSSQEDWLGGPIAVYLDGRFVGRSEIGTVARGQKFVVGFGADPQLRARRELADKDDKIQGGNRELSFNYRLVIENYKDQAAPVRVFDRLPHSERAADVRVTLGELTTPLSKDAVYARVERPKGILRWDTEAPANSSGEKPHLITYKYTVEYDRALHVATPAGAIERQQKEFEDLQLKRNRR
jgi:hypothetical protein